MSGLSLWGKMRAVPTDFLKSGRTEDFFMNRHIEKVILDIKGIIFQEEGLGDPCAFPELTNDISFKAISTI